MTQAIWYGTQHIIQAAVKAAGDNLATLIASAEWDDPFKVGAVPRTPTGYSAGTGAPEDGGFYMSEVARPASPRPVPSVEFFVAGSTKTTMSDAQCDWWRVRIGVRVRVALSIPDASAVEQAAILEPRAISLCQAALTATTQYLRAAALSYDATGALGICWTEYDTQPVVDTGSPRPATAQDAATADAIAYFAVIQRQFAPSGVGSLSA